jgi:hypothetical protein
VRKKLLAIVLAVMLFFSTLVKGETLADASVPRNTFVAEGEHTKVYLYEGVPCTDKVALSIVTEELASKFQKGMVYRDGHSLSMCWIRDGDDVWASVVSHGQAVPAHAEWSQFHKAESI